MVPAARRLDIPAISVTELAKGVGEAWSALDDEAKAQWSAAAVADQERYEAELQALRDSGVDVEALQAAAKAAKQQGKGVGIDALTVPLARVQRLIRADPEAQSVSGDAAKCIARAAELFLEHFTQAAQRTAAAAGRRSLDAASVSATARQVAPFSSILAPDFPAERTWGQVSSEAGNSGARPTEAANDAPAGAMSMFLATAKTTTDIWSTVAPAPAGGKASFRSKPAARRARAAAAASSSRADEDARTAEVAQVEPASEDEAHAGAAEMERPQHQAEPTAAPKAAISSFFKAGVSADEARASMLAHREAPTAGAQGLGFGAKRAGGSKGRRAGHKAGAPADAEPESEEDELLAGVQYDDALDIDIGDIRAAAGKKRPRKTTRRPKRAGASRALLGADTAQPDDDVADIVAVSKPTEPEPEAAVATVPDGAVLWPDSD